MRIHVKTEKNGDMGIYATGDMYKPVLIDELGGYMFSPYKNMEIHLSYSEYKRLVKLIKEKER